MANIFDGLDKLEDSVIIDNIAMLETLSMGNVMKGYGTTAINKGAKFVNGVGKFFGKNFGVTEVEEKRIEDYIEENKNKIRYLKREELNKKLINILSEKNNISILESKDMISSKVIDNIGKSIKLGENMTIGQKADSIHRRYLEKILNTMQENLNKQNSKEAEKTIVQIEKNINDLTDKEKEELKKVLNIETLDGKEIRSVLMKAGTPALIIGGLATTGFGAFMALTTIIHAVFTTILGITLPFAVYTSATSMLSIVLGPIGVMFAAGTAVWQFSKGNKKMSNEVMGQLIFAAVNACGGSFTAKNESLPSYEKDNELLEKIEKKDLEYSNLIKEYKEIKAKLEKSENIYNVLKKDVRDYKKKIISEMERRAESEKKILRLKVTKHTINKNLDKTFKKIKFLEAELLNKEDENLKKKLEEEKKYNEEYEFRLKLLNDDLKYQNRIIDEASKEILEKEDKIKEYEEKNIQLEKQNKEYLGKISIKNEKLKEREKERKKEIIEKWEVYFDKFKIKKEAIRDAAKFSKRERWEIERALIELHSKEDYRAVSRGKIKEKGEEYEHMGFSLPCGFPTRILYSINKNSVKKVTIIKIYKHNEKMYQ